MTNGVPDTGLIEAFKPLKTGGGGDRPKPSCSNCPCSARNTPGGGNELVCTRFPPELTMVLRNTVAGMQQVPNVGFKPVHVDMVCWEHPEMQAKMKREVAAAEARSYGLIPAVRGRPSDGVALGTGTFIAGSEPQVPQRIGDPGVPVHAVGDGQRKPGDEST